MKNKSKLAIALLVVFALSVVTAIPLNFGANAQTSMKTYAISDAIPNIVGLGEQTLLKCGITEALASQSYGWTGITIEVTAPDGTHQTLGPFTTDSTGSTYSLYTPNQVGTYTVKTNFPQQTMPVTTMGNGKRRCNDSRRHNNASKHSNKHIPRNRRTSKMYPSHSLPTEYWSRPIDPQLRDW
jgi:hypothetical protein